MSHYGIEPFQPASQRLGLPKDMPRTPQTPPVDDKTPMEFLRALYGMFRQMSMAPGSRSLQKIKTTPQEGRALGWLNQHGPALMSELADFMDIPLSTATSLVNRLVEKKQVTRQRSEEDRRIVRVHLTPAGQRLSQRMLEVHLEASKLLLQKLSREDQAALIALLQKAGYNPPAKDVC
jgi:DNA-binding MarR family transcriptional regulator